LWPGFGENIRVLDWIIRRCAGEDIAETSPIGFVPKIGTEMFLFFFFCHIQLIVSFHSDFSSTITTKTKTGSINEEGLKDSVDWRQLFHISKTFWESEVDNIEKYFTEQINEDVPPEIIEEIKSLRQRLLKMK